MIPGIDEAAGIDLVGYTDLDSRPAFKLALLQRDGRWFLYCGHHWNSGWSIVDVTDPAAPTLVRFVEAPHYARTAQIQVSGNLMITSLEEPTYGDRSGFDASIAGALIYELTDPTHPRLVGQYRSGGVGLHRNFYDGGRYLYATIRNKDLRDGQFAIVDLEDPSQPREVARWPGQRADTDYFHGPAYVIGDRGYASFGSMVIFDLADRTDPHVISQFSLGDLGGIVGCHSVVPIPDRRLAIVNSETLAEGTDYRYTFAACVDISDETNPRVISTLPVPRISAQSRYASYVEKGGRFGPHNQHHHQNHPDLWRPSRHVVMTYFTAGLRIFDVQEPMNPVEVAYFVPDNPATRHGPRPRDSLVTHFEDVLVDRRGNIFVSDANHGLFVLRYQHELD
jgi:hypothetical protein